MTLRHVLPTSTCGGSDVPPKPRRFTDLEKGYSPKKWPSVFGLRHRFPNDEKKRGPGLESRAVSGHTQGPISGEDLYRLKEGIDGLENQVPEIPETGDEDTILQRVVDEFGHVYLAMRVRDDGTTDERWTYQRMPSLDNPDFEIPEGGTIDVNGAPYERPITLKGGGLRIPTGSTSSTSDQDIGLSRVPVAVFPASVVSTAHQQTAIPEGYNGGTLVARWYGYASAAGVGTAIMGIQAKSLGNGSNFSVALGTYTEVTLTTVTTNELIISALSAEFTPEGTPDGGEEFHFYMQRDGVTDTYASDFWLSQIQVMYKRDQFTDKV